MHSFAQDRKVRGRILLKGQAMAATPSLTVKRKRLGLELRRLREEACLTCEQVGEKLDCSGTRVSRIETGKIASGPGDVRELLEVYGLEGDEAKALVQLAREARKKGWWHTYGMNLPSWFEGYVAFETEATTLSDYQPLLVPGLLQTEDYARAVLHASPPEGSAKDIDRQVSLRMERQAILTKNDPPELWFVISETALRVQVGTPEVMADQLHHLAELAVRPNIRMQVLPFTAAAHVNPVTGFRVLGFPDPRDPTIVYIEHLTGALFLEREEEIGRYRVVFDHLRAEALGIGPSVELITRIADEMS
jgi:transcriptional regulator with XRE-family HTH domain